MEGSSPSNNPFLFRSKYRVIFCKPNSPGSNIPLVFVSLNLMPLMLPWLFTLPILAIKLLPGVTFKIDLGVVEIKFVGEKGLKGV